MSRSNLKRDVRRRMRYTGEQYQQAILDVAERSGRPPLIPDALHPVQQQLEASVLCRLLYGSRNQWPAGDRPRCPLFVQAVSPSATGLRVVVPANDVPAFGASLAMRGVTASRSTSTADEILIHQSVDDGVALQRAGGLAPSKVDLQCSWKELSKAVRVGRRVSASPGGNVRIDGGPATRLPAADQAVLSGLLRRITLFAEADALDWLFAWHEWAMRDRAGTTPRLPAGLMSDLADERAGLQPVHLPALSIGAPGRRLIAASATPSSEGRSGTAVSRSERTRTSRMRHDLATPLGPPGDATTRAAASEPDQRPATGAGRYDALAVTIMRLDPANPIQRVYHAMRFPGRWKAPLRQLAQAARGGVARIPISSLNETVTAVIPDCVVMLSPATGGDNDHDWLLAYHPVDVAAIFGLVTAWVRSQPAPPEQIQRTLSQLSAADLSWSPLEITPDLPFSQLARLIPMEAAATLTQRDAKTPMGNLRFLRCPTDAGAELISWPPLHVGRAALYSIRLGISVQTVPTSSESLVFLSFGVRRWMASPARLTVDRGYPVFLASAAPSLYGLTPSPHFSRAAIKLAAVSQGDGRSARRPRWDDALTGVLEAAGCFNALPDPEEVVAEPTKFLEWNGGAVALAYRQGMAARETVSDGLSASDRSQLMSWIVGELEPQFRPVGPLARERCTIYKGLASHAEGTIAPAVLLDAIGPRLTIELFAESDVTARCALDELGQQLGARLPDADMLGEAETLINFGPVTIGVRRLVPQGVPADLAGRDRREQTTAVMRTALVLERLGHANHPTITLVEFSERDLGKGKDRYTEQRSALRRVLLDSGRLSQFLAPAGESVKSSRLRAGQDLVDAIRQQVSFAVDDLLRQLGVRATPLPAPAPNTLTGGPALLAIWMTSQQRGARGAQRQVPVAVLADPTGRRVHVRTPATDWLPLHRGLIEISRAYGQPGHKYGSEETTRFIKEVVEYASTAYRDTLTLTHAQNLRSMWTFLANRQVELDTLHLDTGSRRPISELPGVRHVRVRTMEGGETPECYGISDSRIGHSAGLWRYLAPRLFGSTTGKPAMHKDASASTSKIAPSIRAGRSAMPNPVAPVWNAQFVELLVAGLQAGDWPEHWAALAHDLRNAAPYYHGSTTLPWPMHLAMQVQEYLPPLESQ